MLRSRAYGVYVLALLAGLNFLNYATRNIVVTMYDDLRADFAMSNLELGLLSSVFMFVHAAMNVPFGWAGDRYDRRKVIAAGAVLWSLANLAAALAGGAGSLIASRALSGLGTAACVPVANALLCDVFPEETKARTVAVLNLGLFLGGGAGFIAGTELGFPNAFVAVAIPGFVLALLLWRSEVPARGGDAAPTTFLQFAGAAKELLAIRTLRTTMLGAIFSAFAAGGYITWFADFLSQVKGLSETEATYALGGLALTGGLAGVIFGGYLGDRLRRRRAHGRLLSMALGHLFAVPAAVCAIYFPAGWAFFAVSWVLMFCINWYHGPMAATVDDLVPKERAAAAQGLFIALMHLLGTSTAPVIVGAVVDVWTLREALLLPTAALAMAAGCYFLAGRSFASDSEAAGKAVVPSLAPPGNSG